MSVEKMKKMRRMPTWYDIAQLVIALLVPLTIISYTIIDNNTERSIAQENRFQDLKIADERHGQSLVLLEEEQEEATLVHYFDSLAKLLERNRHLINQTNIARFKTLNAFAQLKPKRKLLLIRSLIENRLIRVHDKGPFLDLSLADLNGLDLSNNVLDNNELICIHLSKAKLINSSFKGLFLHGSMFNEAHLTHADFSSTTIYEWRCGGYSNAGTFFRRANLDQSNFDSAKYIKAIFRGSSMINSQMNSFSCTNCVFSICQMNSIRITNSKFISEYSPTGSFQNTNLTSASIEKTLFEDISMSQADLLFTNISQTTFNRTDFTFANWKDSFLNQNSIYNATFFFTNLTNSFWNETNVFHSVFNRTDLTNWKFVNGLCYFCIFDQVDFSTVDFTNSSLDGTDFRRTNLKYEQLIFAKSIHNIILPNQTFF